jgi:hypothetical protein
MTDENTPSIGGETKHCGCDVVTGRCYTCRHWFCSHLLKRLAGRWFCVECWGRETEA